MDKDGEEALAATYRSRSEDEDKLTHFLEHIYRQRYKLSRELTAARRHILTFELHSSFDLWADEQRLSKDLADIADTEINGFFF
jgi:hypothetical protein